MWCGVLLTADVEALTAFMVFCMENRHLVVHENPGLSFGQVGRVLGTRWREFPPEKKEVTPQILDVCVRV